MAEQAGQLVKLGHPPIATVECPWVHQFLMAHLEAEKLVWKVLSLAEVLEVLLLVDFLEPRGVLLAFSGRASGI